MDIHVLQAHYLAVWKKAFNVLLDWSEDQVEKFAERYRDRMNVFPSMFYNEDPLYYVARELIPPALVFKWNPDENELAYRIQDMLLSGAQETLPADLQRLKDTLPVFEWAHQFAKYQKEMKNKNVWLDETRLDEYDWNAAKTRVESILAEYGENLPKNDN